MEYKPNWILPCGCDPRCLGEIWQLESAVLPIWGILPDNSINIDMVHLSNINLLCKLTTLFSELRCFSSMAKAVLLTVVLLNSETSASVISLNFTMCAFARSNSPFNWSHVLIDGDKLDNTRFICRQGCHSPQVCSTKWIAMKMNVYNHLKQYNPLTQHY
jgi:hypothetical protein